MRGKKNPQFKRNSLLFVRYVFHSSIISCSVVSSSSFLFLYVCVCVCCAALVVTLNLMQMVQIRLHPSCPLTRPPIPPPPRSGKPSVVFDGDGRPPGLLGAPRSAWARRDIPDHISKCTHTLTHPQKTSNAVEKLVPGAARKRDGDAVAADTRKRILVRNGATSSSCLSTLTRDRKRTSRLCARIPTPTPTKSCCQKGRSVGAKARQPITGKGVSMVLVGVEVRRRSLLQRHMRSEIQEIQICLSHPPVNALIPPIKMAPRHKRPLMMNKRCAGEKEKEKAAHSQKTTALINTIKGHPCTYVTAGAFKGVTGEKSRGKTVNKLIRLN